MLSSQEIDQDLLKLKEIVIKHKSSDSALETQKAVIDGVELDVFAKVPNNLLGIYKLGLEVADEDFLIYFEERFSYGKTLDIATNMANVLINNYGINKGDRVAICSRNNPEWCMAYMAITMIGAIVVPMNSWWQGSELEFGLQDSGAKLLFADQQRMDAIGPLLDNLDIEIIAIKPEPSCEYPEFHQLASDASQAEKIDLDSVEILPDDDVSIMYTSGSTGNPKGVLSTHRQVISALYSWIFGKEVNEIMRPELVEKNPEFFPGILANVPLFHVTGSHAQFLLSFIHFRKFVMMYKWDAEKALELIEQERLSILHGVPTMAWEVMNSPKFESTDLRSLRSVAGGGAPRSPEHLTRMLETFPKKALPSLGYGLTETNAIAATISGVFYESKPHSTGRPTVPVTTIKIVDDEGNTLDPEQVGEICVRGATVMKGYWRNPEATKEVLQDGWFRTGDIGRFDDQGFLIIMDRAKDIVIRGGENIGCAEVEYAINEHPDVFEVTVFGLPDERLGEIVAAIVMLRPEKTLAVPELQQFLQDKIARFKIPSTIKFQYEQLPRIASGKIAKKEIRENFIAKPST